MKAAVLPNLDKRGAYDVVLKLGEILKNEESNNDTACSLLRFGDGDSPAGGTPS